MQRGHRFLEVEVEVEAGADQLAQHVPGIPGNGDEGLLRDRHQLPSGPRSEGRYSTSFEFVTPSGRPVIYRSPLSGGTGGTGEGSRPRARPAIPAPLRTQPAELNARSEDWFTLGVLTVVEVAMLLGMVLVVLHENGVIH
ncbi:hypothetical protein [Streptomyces sp. ms115]|uniref:hypothetical protein n=1 Tax=Streptomyces sp. ms115 TaxID=1827928 RepID=UPI00117E2136|nr:hypothetical protein [Streptomyces sp. ms115]